MNNATLTISNLNGIHKSEQTIRDIEITLKQHQSMVIFGANGAGKTSLLRAIMGLDKISSGTIQMNGQNFHTMSTRQRAHLGIGYCPEGRRLFPGLTVWETLAVSFSGKKAERDQRIEEIFALLPALKIKKGDRAWSLSGGQQQMLAIARATINTPKLILLDEPTLGLSPVMIDEIMEIIGSIKKNGATIIMAEQKIEPGLSIGDLVIVLSRGEIIYKGPSDDIDPDQIASMVMTGSFEPVYN